MRRSSTRWGLSASSSSAASASASASAPGPASASASASAQPRSTSARQAATSAPASRSRPAEASAAAVATAKPGPPRAVTTTPASPGPVVEISPAVEHPTSGMSPATSWIPARSLVEVVTLAAEHDQQFGILAGERLSGRLVPGRPRLDQAGLADGQPALCRGVPVSVHRVHLSDRPNPPDLSRRRSLCRDPSGLRHCKALFYDEVMSRMGLAMSVADWEGVQDPPGQRAESPCGAVRMNPAPRPVHQHVVRLLTNALADAAGPVHLAVFDSEWRVPTEDLGAVVSRSPARRPRRPGFRPPGPGGTDRHAAAGRGGGALAWETARPTSPTSERCTSPTVPGITSRSASPTTSSR